MYIYRNNYTTFQKTHHSFMEPPDFVLFTADGQYVVEYLFKQLVVTSNISEALTFDNNSSAQAFKKRLEEECDLDCSVNTYINCKN